jgi:hypothetical protein
MGLGIIDKLRTARSKVQGLEQQVRELSRDKASLQAQFAGTLAKLEETHQRNIELINKFEQLKTTKENPDDSDEYSAKELKILETVGELCAQEVSLAEQLRAAYNRGVADTLQNSSKFIAEAFPQQQGAQGGITLNVMVASQHNSEFGEMTRAEVVPSAPEQPPAYTPPFPTVTLGNPFAQATAYYQQAPIAACPYPQLPASNPFAGQVPTATPGSFVQMSTSGTDIFAKIAADKQALAAQGAAQGAQYGSVFLGSVQQDLIKQEEAFKKADSAILGLLNYRTQMVTLELQKQQGIRGQMIVVLGAENDAAIEQYFSGMKRFPEGNDEANAMFRAISPANETTWMKISDELDKMQKIIHDMGRKGKLRANATPLVVNEELYPVIAYNKYCKGGKYSF